MVRLKATDLMILFNEKHNFNSTMVRLKEYVGLNESIPENPFQFHYGTIKSYCHLVQ